MALPQGIASTNISLGLIWGSRTRFLHLLIRKEQFSDIFYSFQGKRRGILGGKRFSCSFRTSHHLCIIWCACRGAEHGFQVGFVIFKKEKEMREGMFVHRYKPPVWGNRTWVLPLLIRKNTKFRTFCDSFQGKRERKFGMYI